MAATATTPTTTSVFISSPFRSAGCNGVLGGRGGGGIAESAGRLMPPKRPRFPVLCMVSHIKVKAICAVKHRTRLVADRLRRPRALE